jgi:tetratricopeptide (TPR) repeat protein
MTLALIDLLAIFYQNGNLLRMESIARSMLSAVPNDMVALQFLGLSLYMRGHPEDAYKLFRRFASGVAIASSKPLQTSCELAATASYQAATRPGSGLAPGWHGIAQILAQLGYRKHAANASKAARAAEGRTL